MTIDQLKRVLIDRNRKMDAAVVSMPRAEFWRFYELVWREAQNEARLAAADGCGVADVLMGMWGGRR